MTIERRLRILSVAFSLFLVLLMSGCSTPGFGSMSENEAKPRHYLGYKPVVETGEEEVEGAPVGAINSISLPLIQSQRAATPRTIPSNIRSLIGIAPTYTIGAGDVVGVVVYDHPELLPSSGAVISQQIDPAGVSVAPGFIVGSTGEISFPYIGRIVLSGLTEIEASELIRVRLATYIRDPQVTVRIASFRSRRAYVEGEVRSPGIQIFTDVPMTLAEAINRAGGITSAGDRSNISLKRSGRTDVINLTMLQDLGVDATQIPLQNGDVVLVKSREESKIYVMGEILRPSALLMRNGRMSLNEALGEAGGPNLLTANAAQIYVIRNNGEERPVVFNLNAKNPIALALADKFELMPRDVVYIDPVPLVRWSRIVNLILPSAQVLDYGSSAVTR